MYFIINVAFGNDCTFCNKIDAIAITVVFYNESVAFCNRVSWWIKYEIIATIGYQKEREREREREHNFPIHDLQSSQRFGTWYSQVLNLKHL